MYVAVDSTLQIWNGQANNPAGNEGSVDLSQKALSVMGIKVLEEM
jgi:hypothetical protein